MMECIHKAGGCPWKGDINELKIHLDTCPHDLVDCEKCGKKVANVALEEHLNVFCVSMPRKCHLCGITSTGKEQQNHTKVCLKQPISCPNDCNIGFIAREKMDQHLENECLKISTACVFKNLGCKYEGTKLSLNKHMQTYMSEHLMIISGVVADQAAQIGKMKREKQKVDQQLNTQAMEIAKIKRNQEVVEEQLTCQISEQALVIQKQGEKIDRLEKLLAENSNNEKLENVDDNEIKDLILKSPTRESSFIWIIKDFINFSSLPKYWSPAFYTSTNGYKVQAYCVCDTKKQCIDIGIELNKGEYDEVNKWPFIFDVWFTVTPSKGNKARSLRPDKCFMNTSANTVTRDYFKAPLKERGSAAPPTVRLNVTYWSYICQTGSCEIKIDFIDKYQRSKSDEDIFSFKFL